MCCRLYVIRYTFYVMLSSLSSSCFFIVYCHSRAGGNPDYSFKNKNRKERVDIVIEIVFIRVNECMLESMKNNCSVNNKQPCSKKAEELIYQKMVMNAYRILCSSLRLGRGDLSIFKSNNGTSC